MQNPSFRVGALKSKIIKQASRFMRNGHEVSIVMGEDTAISSHSLGLCFEKINQIVVKTSDLLKFSVSYYDGIQKLYQNDEIYINSLKDFYQEKLKSCTPDIIFSWESPVPFFKQLYPNTPIVHMMPGMFSRPPFPELLSLDISGFYKDSILINNKSTLEKYKPSQNEIEFITKIKKDIFQDFLSVFCPSKIKEIVLNNKYKYRVLLPLQVSGYYAFDENCLFKNQFDYLIYVLEKVSPEIGVVVTQYVTPSTKDTPITEETWNYIKKKYPNVIFSWDFNQIDSISQHILPLVDGVITISSSIGLQAALFEKPVFCLGKSHVNIVSEKIALENLVSFFETKKYDSKEKLNALTFLLTRIQPLTITHTLTSDWLIDFSERLIEKYKNGITDLNAYDLIEDIESYQKKFFKSCKFDIAKTRLCKTSFGDEIRKEIESLESITRKIENTNFSIVSFDIFDTLLVRPFQKPTDIFVFINDDVYSITKGKLPNFSKKRIHAEQFLREQSKFSNYEKEITLDGIYSYIAEKYKLSELETEEIKNLEINTEKKFLLPRKFGIKLFNIAKEKGKRIIITSDMYLSRDTICDILKDNEIDGYEKLYLSSDIGVKKHDGLLFNHIISDLQINPKSILHIGDNPIGDIKRAEERKISTIHTEKTSTLFHKNSKYKQLFASNKNDTCIMQSSILATISNKLFDNPTIDFKPNTLFNTNPFYLGYSGLGWLFLAFAKHIIEESIADGISDLFFLSRDGEIIKKSYDIIAKHYSNAPNSHYLYSSRRSVRGSSIFNKQDVEELANSKIYRTSIKRIFEGKIGFNIDTIDPERYRKFGFNNTNYICSSKEDISKLRDFIVELSDEIIKHSMEEREALIDYLLSTNINECHSPAVVDIGYAGSMQKGIMKLLDIDNLSGYYLLTFKEAQKINTKSSKVKAFCGNFIDPQTSWNPITKLGLAFEVMFSNCDGSFIKAEKDINNKLNLVFSSTERESRKKMILPQIHLGITTFLEDWCKSFGDDIHKFYFDSESCFTIIYNYLLSPTGRDSEIFEGVSFDDSFSGKSLSYMIPPRSSGIISAEEMKNAIWKQGTNVFFRRPDIAASTDGQSTKNYIKAFSNNIIPIEPNKFFSRNIKKLFFNPKEILHDFANIIYHFKSFKSTKKKLHS